MREGSAEASSIPGWNPFEADRSSWAADGDASAEAEVETAQPSSLNSAEKRPEATEVDVSSGSGDGGSAVSVALAASVAGGSIDDRSGASGEHNVTGEAVAAEEVAAATHGSSSIAECDRVHDTRAEGAAATAVFFGHSIEDELRVFGDVSPAAEDPAAASPVSGDGTSGAKSGLPVGAYFCVSAAVEPGGAEDSAASGSEDEFGAFDDAPPPAAPATQPASLSAGQRTLGSGSEFAVAPAVVVAPRDVLAAATSLLEELLLPAIGGAAVQLAAPAALPTLQGLMDQFPSLGAPPRAGEAGAASNAEAEAQYGPSMAEARLLARLVRCCVLSSTTVVPVPPAAR